MKTLLFYDLETTGLNKAFDQIVQFAAIRTDTNFNELERFEMMIKLNLDVIPTAGATITHRTTLASLENAISEYEAIKKIHEIMNITGTVSLGYNTLGFDDEFLRFSFYRNLLTPYTHQFANQCSRADIYPMTTMYYLFNRDALKWPMKDGKLSLKLENLAELNQLCNGQAHTAIVDVEATVALAKKLQSKSPKIWTYLMEGFDKTADAKRIAQLPRVIENCQLGVMIEGILGARNNYCAPVLGLGLHRHYKNQTIWLRLDLEELAQTSKKDIAKTTWALSKKLAEPGFLLPPTDHYQQHISSERKKIMETNLAWLKENIDILEAIIDHHLDYTYPVVQNIDIDAALYTDGFLSQHDNQQCSDFHKAKEKSAFVDKFNNNKLHDMAIRVLGRLDKNLLNEEQRESFDAYLQKIWGNEEIVDFKNQPHLTPEKALDEIHEYRQKELDEEQIMLLDELANYFTNK